jgi:NADH-quinone oxidoreductase subunit G
MATVYVDGKPYQMDPAQNLLHGCIADGLNLPYFCWHPALGSVGACRQCAGEQFKANVGFERHIREQRCPWREWN